MGYNLFISHKACSFVLDHLKAYSLVLDRLKACSLVLDRLSQKVFVCTNFVISSCK